MHKYVLTYDVFLFNSLFNLEKENREISNIILESLICQFNQKAICMDFISNIEILTEQDEIDLFWELDPGDIGGSLFDITQFDQAIECIVVQSGIASN